MFIHKALNMPSTLTKDHVKVNDFLSPLGKPAPSIQSEKNMSDKELISLSEQKINGRRSQNSTWSSEWMSFSPNQAFSLICSFFSSVYNIESKCKTSVKYIFKITLVIECVILETHPSHVNTETTSGVSWLTTSIMFGVLKKANCVNVQKFPRKQIRGVFSHCKSDVTALTTSY